MLAGLFGIGAVKKLIPSKEIGTFRNPSSDWESKFISEFRYYLRPEYLNHTRIIFHKRNAEREYWHKLESKWNSET